MASHRLSLNVTPTLNTKVLILDDTSVYDENISVDCPILEITLPGFSRSIQLTTPEIIPGNRWLITTCNLSLANCSQINGLPDGVYVIRYSVSPNDTVFVEYNHLRISSLQNTFDKTLCSLDGLNCEPTSEIQKQLLLLDNIRLYMLAAVANVEICHEPGKGMELYRYAKKLLSGMKCKTCL